VRDNGDAVSSPDRRSLLPAALVAIGVAAIVALAIALVGSLIASVVTGLLVLAVGLRLAWVVTRPAQVDESRRRVLLGLGAAGVAAVAGGSAIGRVTQHATRSDPTPDLDHMARSIGSEAVGRVKRGYFPGRSGDLQLVLEPWNTSNYANESLALEHDDPRSSHAMNWGYLDRIPITVYAPGIVTKPETRDDVVTLADLAPTTAHLMNFGDFQTKDGAVMPGVPSVATPPKVIVTFVIDGGGWNVFTHWKHSWPFLRQLMSKSIVYRNAFMGSFPTVTACAHATIGTGEFPQRHGISGHNVRYHGKPAKAYGTAGHADPSFIVVPTLSDAWSEHTGHRAWIGEIGYQIWHLGMIGKGGTKPLGKDPVAVYFDEDVAKDWAPQNPDLYRFPAGMPTTGDLVGYLQQYGEMDLDQGAGRKLCCTPPIVHYQGDVVAAALRNEPVGQGGATSLLYVNYKMPDYTGHVYNFLRPEEARVIRHVDLELKRLVKTLESMFQPGEYALIVTADHGQCPLVDTAGGVRLDPIQLEQDIGKAFGKSVVGLVEAVWPSEVYLSGAALWDAGVTRGEIAAFLRDYRYRDNIGPYVAADAIDAGRLNRPEFAAVFSTDYIGSLTDAAIARAGPGNYGSADPGMPPVTW
jgi:type I phosphodiesterase/nucleotide pyrophosphatase